MTRKRPHTHQPQRGNDGTIEFFNHIQDRCAAIASQPPSQHDAEIINLSKETGLSPTTLSPVIERYAHLRVPDYPSLASQFIERTGRLHVRAMLATGYGKRELTTLVQTALADERLTITGPRVALFVDAIAAQFQPSSAR